MEREKIVSVSFSPYSSLYRFRISIFFSPVEEVLGKLGESHSIYQVCWKLSLQHALLPY